MFQVPKTNQIEDLLGTLVTLRKYFQLRAKVFSANPGECQIDKVGQKLATCDEQAIDADKSPSDASRGSF